MADNDQYTEEWIDEAARAAVARDSIRSKLADSTKQILDQDTTDGLFSIAKGFVTEFVRQQREGVQHVNAIHVLPFRTVDEFEEAEEQGKHSLFQVKLGMKSLADLGVSQEENFKVIAATIQASISEFVARSGVRSDTISVKRDGGFKSYLDSLYSGKKSGPDL